MPIIGKLPLAASLLISCIALGVINKAQAEIIKYDLSGVITKIPSGGMLPTHFNGFLGQPATFSYSIDTANIFRSDANTYRPLHSVNFTFHTISGSLDANTSFYVYSTNSPYPHTNFGIEDAILTSVAGAPSELDIRFTQFTIANLSTNVLGSVRLPINYSLSDYPLRIMQLTFQETTGDPMYSDQLRADFDNLTITSLPAVPESDTLTLLGIGLLGIWIWRRRSVKYFVRHRTPAAPKI